MGTGCERIGKARYERGEIVAVWIQAASLLLLAEFLAFSYGTGRLRYFLAPAYLWLPPAAAGVLAAMWAARLWDHFRTRWLEAAAFMLLVEFLVLLLFPNAVEAVFVAFAPLNDAIRLLVSPACVRLSQATALLLVVVCAIRLRGRGRRAAGRGCESSGARPASTLVCMALLVTPVAIALAINPTGLSPEGARKRRASPPPRDPALAQAVNWVLGLKTRDKKAADGPVTLPKNPSVLDVLKATDGARSRPEGSGGRFSAAQRRNSRSPCSHLVRICPHLALEDVFQGSHVHLVSEDVRGRSP